MDDAITLNLQQPFLKNHAGFFFFLILIHFFWRRRQNGRLSEFTKNGPYYTHKCIWKTSFANKKRINVIFKFPKNCFRQVD